MIDDFVEILRTYPTLALFLTVGVGFFIGRWRIGNFSIGSVTGVLLTAVLVGQLDIPMSGPIKMFFFMMFLFSIGYKVGPEFFRSLRGTGAKQVLFAVLMSTVCFAVTLSLALLMGYSKGETIGLFSGSQTCSAVLGVGGEALQRLDMPADELKEQLNIIPVCYAVTYIFGTLGTVIMLGNLGPRMLGGIDKVKKLTAEFEKQINADEGEGDPSYVNALRKVTYRSYRVCDRFFRVPRTVHDTEMHFRSRGVEAYIDHLRHNGKIRVPRFDDTIELGDEVVVCGRQDAMVEVENILGQEIFDSKLQSYPLTRVGVVVAHGDFVGHELAELRTRKYMHGVVIRDAVRSGKPMEIDGSTTFAKGDRLTVIGRPVQVRKATARMGHVDRPSVSSDLMFVGLAIFVGGLFGALSFWVGSIPVSFGTSGGALVSGLVFGWLRSRRPTFGHIPDGALWLMNNLGLNVFIAVIGIESATSFIAGIRAVGPMLFVIGAVATILPLLFGLWLGHKVFKFTPAITLGCCSGTRTCTASLGAIQDAIGSATPAMGYTVTYAVSNLLLVIWGLVAAMVV